MTILGAPAIVAVGLVLCSVAISAAVYLIGSPQPVRLAMSRRRPGAEPTPGLLERTTDSATRLIDRLLRTRGSTADAAAALELAGIRMRPQDLILVLLGATLGCGAIGMLLVGVLLGIVFALAVPVIAKLVLNLRTSRRQRAFADQLEDSLQMMSGSLRAGHSLVQSLKAVAEEGSSPIAEEFARVVNETRVGRDVGQALDETATRMASPDMVWIAQAIAINRQVGGNLAEVLDAVGHTIRERGQIRRQVKALSAEGRLSAIILMLLPFGVAGFLMMTNPAYLAKFTASLFGYGLLVVSGGMLIVGGLWLRKVTTLTF